MDEEKLEVICTTPPRVNPTPHITEVATDDNTLGGATVRSVTP